MAHELDFTADGRVAMAYLNGDQPPWHANETRPQIVDPGADIAVWAEAAGLNYQIEVSPNYKADGTAIEDSFHIARTDTGAVVGPYIAGQWRPVQNSEALETCGQHPPPSRLRGCDRRGVVRRLQDMGAA